jgi:hypothetical protein
MGGGHREVEGGGMGRLFYSYACCPNVLSCLGSSVLAVLS